MDLFSNFKTKQSLAVIGAFLCAGAAQAADVQLYGVLDTGFLYTHDRLENQGGRFQDEYQGTASAGSLVMESSINYGSRFGLKGSEEFAPGVRLGFVLESGIMTDSGEFKTANRIFDREAQLYLESDLGRLAFGRIGPVSGSIGAYHQLTLRGDALDGGFYWLTRNVYDNMVTYVSPDFAGAKAYLQYSFETNSSAGLEGNADAERYASAAITLDRGPLQAVVMADTIMRSSTADPRLGDAYSVGFGANYKIGDVTPYLGFQLGRNETVWNWVGASSFLSANYLAKHNVSGVIGQFDGWSTTVGALFENMPGTPGANIQAAVFYGKADGEIFNAGKTTEKADFEEDLEKYGFIAMYIFPLSKKALVYAGGAYTAERMERSGADIDHDTWQAAAGMAIAF